MVSPSDVSRTSDDGIGTAKTNYVVGMLFIIYLLNFLDRQIINILAEPIKADLQLADWQIGVMTGLAFALFYSVLGVPVARYADRPTTNRPRLIAVALALWSAMTALCGLAQNFLQLFLARIGVGIGESACSPAAHSLISDIVPKEKLGRAMGVYSLGIPFGKLIGMALGGIVAELLGWRIALILVGVPGVLIAIIAWITIPEPRLSRPKPVSAVKAPSLIASISQLSTVRTFWWVSIAGGFMSFLSYGQNAFMGSFFIRVYDFSVGEAGVMLGLAFGAAGALGTWIGSQVSDRMSLRNPRAQVLLPLGAALIGGGLFAASVMMPTATGALLMLAAAAALNASWYGPIFAAVQNIVPKAQRATAAAVHLFMLSIIGLGLGPLGFGLLSDFLNAGGSLGPFEIPPLGAGEGLRYALVFASLPAALIAAFAFWRASRTIQNDLAFQDA